MVYVSLTSRVDRVSTVTHRKAQSPMITSKSTKGAQTTPTKMPHGIQRFPTPTASKTKPVHDIKKFPMSLSPRAEVKFASPRTKASKDDVEMLKQKVAELELRVKMMEEKMLH